MIKAAAAGAVPSVCLGLKLLGLRGPACALGLKLLRLRGPACALGADAPEAVRPRPAVGGQPGPRHPRPESLSLDSEAMWDDVQGWLRMPSMNMRSRCACDGVCHASRQRCMLSFREAGKCRIPWRRHAPPGTLTAPSLPCGVVWRGAAPASGGARGGQRPCWRKSPMPMCRVYAFHTQASLSDPA